MTPVCWLCGAPAIVEVGISVTGPKPEPYCADHKLAALMARVADGIEGKKMGTIRNVK